MTNAPLKPRPKLAIKQATRNGRALVKDIQYRLDVNTLHRDKETKELGLSVPSRLTQRGAVRSTVPEDRAAGSLIRIDEVTSVTVRDRMSIGGN